MKHLNLDLELFDYRAARDEQSFRVRVADSPAGEQRLADAERSVLAADLGRRLRQLEKRLLTLPEMIALGEELAAALFPPRARELLELSRARLDEDEGLRIRMRIDTYALADLPWEYAYVARRDTPAGQKGPDGFLALDRRVSLARYEVQSQWPGTLTPVGTGPLRLVVLLANPDDPAYPPLRLDDEQRNIGRAVAEISGLRAEFYRDATVDVLQEALVRPTHIFHFAEHGVFQGEMGAAFGSVEGEGALVLLGENRRAAPLSARRLALTLTGRGVRLAVLGACEAGRRDGVNAWTGVAPALTRAGIPAVAAMQYTIRDANALAFTRFFYSALAAGETIDAAVTEGRLAIFNRGDDDERDCGAPVLYLRAEEGNLFWRRGPAGGRPRLAVTDPADGAAGVRRDLTQIRLTFDRDMDPSGVSISSLESAFSLTGVSHTLQADGRTFTVKRANPGVLLPANALISFNVNEPGRGNAFRDADGNLAEPSSFNFTTGAEPASAAPHAKRARPAGAAVDARSLREAMTRAFSMEELEVLCADVQDMLHDAGIDEQVSLELVGGASKVARVLNLIQFLERRGYLGYLVEAVRATRPGTI